MASQEMLNIQKEINKKILELLEGEKLGVGWWNLKQFLEKYISYLDDVSDADIEEVEVSDDKLKLEYYYLKWGEWSRETYSIFLPLEKVIEAIKEYGKSRTYETFVKNLVGAHKVVPPQFIDKEDTSELKRFLQNLN